MSAVGLLGLLLNLAALPFASARLTQPRILLFAGLFAAHLMTAIAYHLYSLGNPTDSRFYYFDPMRMAQWDFQFGTVFTIQATQFFRTGLGATYFDCFLIFQSVGFWGIIILLRIFDEVHSYIGAPRSPLVYSLLFLPGIHFWSSAIGKDGPLFFAVCLAIWSIMRLRRRIYFLAAALAVMVLFRPHIALIGVIALAAAAFFERRFGLLTRASLLTFALIGVALVATSVESTFEVRLTDANSVADFFSRRNQIAQTVEGSTAVHNAPFFFKLFSLLFRPLFVDAEGLFALIASVENLILLFVIGFLAVTWPSGRRLVRSVFVLKFALVFAVLLTVALTMIYYNVGLGLRQKWMIFPAVLSLFAAQWAVFHLPPRNIPNVRLQAAR